MDNNQLDQHLNKIVPASTQLKQDIDHLWMLLVALEPNSPGDLQAQECKLLAVRLESKLRALAVTLQQNQVS
jgi:hypothetical protein